VALNALLLYPDRPFGLGNLYGWEFNPETQRREKFLISETADLSEQIAYSKERRLVDEVKAELACGRRCQIYAVYTQKRDVTRRLEHILANEGIRVTVLTTEVPPESREGWYERQLRAGVQAVICHPKLVQTGLDLIEFPTILFYETGYSIYVLRQASRRSWRIGQRLPVKVKFLHYAETMQESCLRLMGKKLLVSLAMEGKFSSEGLQAINEEDDILMAMARELVTEKGIGEHADAIWAALQKRQEEVFTARSSEIEVAAPELPQAIELAVADSSVATIPQGVSLAAALQPLRRKTSRREGSLEGQLTLF
jgi:Helicase conserved C-terminal domain